jgi:hypothetical protein
VVRLRDMVEQHCVQELTPTLSDISPPVLLSPASGLQDRPGADDSPDRETRIHIPIDRGHRREASRTRTDFTHAS